jgi:hypothetical protein
MSKDDGDSTPDGKKKKFEGTGEWPNFQWKAIDKKYLEEGTRYHRIPNPIESVE